MADDDFTRGNQAFANLLEQPAPHFYTNGITLAQSLSDITMVMQLNGKPGVVVHASFNTIKTLVQQLTELMSVLEKATGQPILSMDEIKDKMDPRSGGVQ